MSDLTPATPSASVVPTQAPTKVTPLNCFTGSLLAGTLGLLIYRLTTAIAQSFAAHPAPVSQPLAHNLSVAVRTLVIGMTTLASGVFTLAAVGLAALGLKVLFTGTTDKNNANNATDG
jgi:hypothetical protein